MKLNFKKVLKKKFIDFNFLFYRNILKSGQWSTDGCGKNIELSTTFNTVCECNHLTHFSILLSPRPIDITGSLALSLSIFGSIGVIISVVAMTVTVIIFCTLSFYKKNRYVTKV